MKRLILSLRISLIMTVVMTVLLGFVYPAVVTLFAQSIFTSRANGSMIERADKISGSTLLGQEFTSPKYFWGRLSATTPAYNAASSGGSNLSPANPKLLEAANARIAALHKADPSNKNRIPVDLVTASASGVDPHISVPSMLYQLARVAKARGMSEEAVASLAAKSTEHPLGGISGDPFVNVVKLNIALDESKK